MRTIEQKIEQLRVEVGTTYKDNVKQLRAIIHYADLVQKHPDSDRCFDKLCTHLGLLGQLAHDHCQNNLCWCVSVIVSNLSGVYS